jgi:hypothetical protein
LDITNATLRGSEIITTSKVGIANSAPTHTLSVGNKLFVDDSAANVLTVSGNLVATSLKIGQIDLTPSYGLEHVANVINTVSNVVQFTNTTTGFVSVSNVGIGTSTSPAGLLDVVGAFRMRYQDMGVTKAHIITGANSTSLNEDAGTYTYTRGAATTTGNFLPNPSNIVPKVGQRYRVKLTARSDYAGTIRYECPTSTIITTYDLTTSFKEYTWDFNAEGTTMQFAVTTPLGSTTQFNAFSIERLGVGFNVNPTSTAAPVQISGVTHFSDNVGIGTDSPSVPLTVYGSDPADTFGSQVRIVSTSTTGAENSGGVLIFQGHDGVTGRGFASVGGLKENGTSGNHASYLRFSTRASGGGSIAERMRITSTGNVGIGSATPAVKLDVSGIGRFTNDGGSLQLVGTDHTYLEYYPDGVSAGRKAYLGYASAADDNFTIHNAAGSGHILLGSGNVSIGTASPRWGLEVTPTNGLGGILSCSDSPIFSHNLYYSGGWKYGTASTGGAYMRMVDSQVQFWNAPNSGSGTWDTAGGAATATQRMTIDESGNVGIGVASPSRKLDVVGGPTKSDGFILGTSNNIYYPGCIYTDPNWGMLFRSAVSSPGIADFVFNNYAGSNMMVIKNGDVGIGTYNPNVRLHVDSGDIGFEYGQGLKVATSGGSMSAWSSGTHNLLFTNWSSNTGAGDVVKFYTPGSQSSTVRMILTSAGNVGINTETMIDSRNYGGLHLPNSKGISFAADSSQSNSRHWRIRTDDYSDWGSLQIGVSGTNSTPPDAPGEAVMTMTRDRNVGIGYAYPTAPLEIWSGRNADTWSKGQSYFNVLHSANNGYGMSFAVSASHGDGMIQTYHVASGNAQYDLRLQPSGGNVGIGTATPYAKLHVHGSSGNFTTTVAGTSSSYFIYNSGLYVNQAGGFGAVSIYGQDDILSGGYVGSLNGSITASDERIKKEIVDVEDSEALSTLRLLKPKRYKYRDEVKRGQEPVWGFIAQEVKETLPHATQLRQDVIPNIYELANVSSSNVITFTNFNTSNLESNATTLIRLFGPDNKDHDVHLAEIIDAHSIRVEEDLTKWTGSVDDEGNVITEITTTTITPEEYEALETDDKADCVANITGYQNANVSISVEEYNALEDTTGYEQVVQDYTKTSTTRVGNQLFVYGQEVDDFVFLKKEAIWTVATAALQEVDRQLQAEKSKTTALETKLQEAEAKTTTLETKLQTETAALETELQAEKTKTTTLETKLQEAEAKIATLQAEKEAIRSDLSSLVLRVAALES